ncbi:hypothetical protein F5Y08DRAFT_344310 [Xylaria arbuscula]|nr:hypothetical protein F5Y08DRAFT_344310 [Xylaria arbuscula]
MSQQGGVYQPPVKTRFSITRSWPTPQVEKTESEKHTDSEIQNDQFSECRAQARGNLSEKANCSNDSYNDSQEWELISIPEENKDDEDNPNQYFKFHYDLTLGWGKWKHTFVSVDVTKERPVCHGCEVCNHEQSSSK